MSQPTAESPDTDNHPEATFQRDVALDENLSDIEPADSEDPEVLFRRAMAGVTDILWELRYDDEGLCALHDVIEQAVMQREAGENRHAEMELLTSQSEAG